MGRISNFYDLDAWKEGHELVLIIYKMTKKLPAEEKYGIVSQLRRAASSITANIAEGFGRYHYADKTGFYYQARGSLTEIQNFLYLAKDLGYVHEEKLREVWTRSKRCEQLINGLIKSVDNQKRNN